MSVVHRAALDHGLIAGIETYSRSRRIGIIVERHDTVQLATALRLETALLDITNRNLIALEISLATTSELVAEISPNNFTVAESCIQAGLDVDRMHYARVHSFLVGEAIIRPPPS